ncbi:exosome complex component RRP40 [Chrysoperla carnea]|uniref:exosome complex component RRP40 n=1 Tax=Chrysoperla carnea TaxID=189513 RepID=UPI001D06C1B9|nr:exosome complex component RRP40 [Chrysoperla carnea]
MKVKNEDIVIPGDIINEDCLKIDKKMKIIIGPGLKKVGNEIFITNSGILRKKNPNTFWVDFYQRRYVPAKGESILGVVTNKSSEALKLDIGASEQASLSFLAFEGASKKYKPEVAVGDVIYGRLLAAGSDVEPELVCIDHNFKSDRFGVLKDGFIFNCSLNVVYKILNSSCPLLQLLGKEIKHEIVVGLNGKVWVKANNCEDTLAIANAVLKCEFLSNSEIRTMCNEVLNCLKGMS